MDISLRFEDSVGIITWNEGENRINPDSMARMHEIFDELDTVTGPLALVWTGTGKFFSNGLDLERFAAEPHILGPTTKELDRLFGRIISFPAYTVAAVNGHAFAGGAMLTCTTDYRVMREDRGFWCLNEAELGLPLTETMAAVVLARLPKATALEAMNTARRYSALEAVAAGIIEATASESEVLTRAIEVAAHVATKDRKVIAIHKKMVFGELAEKLKISSER